MTTSPPRERRLARRAFGCCGIALCLAAAGCGNDGVGSGGSGSCVVPPNLFSGSISARTGSSIVVDDVTFALQGPQPQVCSSTTIVDNASGSPAASDLLQPGVGVDVFTRGVDTAANGARSAGAGQIDVHDDVIGTVSAVDAPAGALTVLDQTVTVSATTVYAGTSDLARLTPGQAVRVWGLYDFTAGAWRATRIELLASAPAQGSLTGMVASLDSAGKTFRLGGTLVSDAGVAAADVAALVNGVMAQVHVQAAPQAGTWLATAVTVLPTNPGGGGVMDERSVEGIVAQFTDATSFDLPPLHVDARAAKLSNAAGAPATLGVGSRVQVHGKVVAGVLVADTVEVKPL